MWKRCKNCFHLCIIPTCVVKIKGKYKLFFLYSILSIFAYCDLPFSGIGKFSL